MSENQIQDYITYGQTFEEYKWYKPILTFVVSIIIWTVLNIIAVVIFGAVYGNGFFEALTLNYEGMNNPDAANFYGFLSIALFIPSLYLASRIIKDRPFSSYASSRGGWNWKIFFKCLLITLITYVILIIIQSMISPTSTGPNKLNALVFIAFLIIVPLQCIGEEFFFRGLLMQTLGSWIKIPVAALIIQAIIFGLLHSYNPLGVIGIMIGGFFMGIMAWKSNGIEASSAFHSINNLSTIFLALSGIQAASSTVVLTDLIWIIISNVVCCILILYIGKRYDWFTGEN